MSKQLRQGSQYFVFPFLDNTNGSYYIGDKGVEHYHDNLEELNEKNTELYINNIRYKRLVRN